MGLMNSIVSIGSVILQSSVNSLGTIIISAQTAARRIMSFALLPLASISSSITTFTSQNYGAKRSDRIVKGISIGSRLAIFWSLLVSGLLFLFSARFVSFIASSRDPYLIQNGSAYLKISSIFYPVLSLLLIYRNSLQGLGQKLLPLISSFIELFGKIAFVILIIPQTSYLGIILCEPIVWILMTLQLIYSLYNHPIIQEGRRIKN